MTDTALTLFCLPCETPRAIAKLRDEATAARVVARPPVDDELCYVLLACDHRRWASLVVIDAAERARDAAECTRTESDEARDEVSR